MDKTFKIDAHLKIECDWVKTRYGFRHDARLYRDGWLIEKAKACYYNRTWESFEYESVIRDLLTKSKIMSATRIKNFLNKLSGVNKKEVDKKFGMISAIASLGNILCDTQKDKNDWKSRMIKAGLGEGIMMPEDWDTLSEDDKEKRLDAVIGHLQK